MDQIIVAAINIAASQTGTFKNNVAATTITLGTTSTDGTMIIASAATPAAITVRGAINGSAANTGNLTVQNSGGTTFTGIIGGTRISALTISQATTFNAAVSATTLSTTAAISNGTTLNVSSTSSIGANITTSSTQTYTGAVTLTANTTLAGSTVTTSSTVGGGGYSLAITGNSSIGGNISNVTTIQVYQEQQVLVLQLQQQQADKLIQGLLH